MTDNAERARLAIPRPASATALREKRCAACPRPIPAGEQHVYDGDSSRWHAECYKTAAANREALQAQRQPVTADTTRPKIKEETVSKKTDKPTEPVISAKRGDEVRIVHRTTENAWKIWERDTNKMVVRQPFTSKKAAVEFAEGQGWKYSVSGEGRAKAAKKATPKKARAKKAAKRSPKKREAAA